MSDRVVLAIIKSLFPMSGPNTSKRYPVTRGKPSSNGFCKRIVSVAATRLRADLQQAMDPADVASSELLGDIPFSTRGLREKNDQGCRLNAFLFHRGAGLLSVHRA